MAGPHALAPNDVQHLHPLAQRVPLGTPSPVPHGGREGRDGTGVFWFYIPTGLPGTLLITVDSPVPPKLVLSKDKQEVHQSHATTVVIERPTGSHGVYLLEMTPARPVRVRFIMEGWPKEADGSPLVPWNFWYFPFREGAVKTPSFDSTAVQRSAMAKFDRAFGREFLGSALTWEDQNHISKTAESWEGHCAWGALASVYFELPPDQRSHQGVTFTRGELELLASEWAGWRQHPRDEYNVGDGAQWRVTKRNVVLAELLRPQELPDADLIVDRFLEAFPDATPDEAREVRRRARELDPREVEVDFGNAATELLSYLDTRARAQGEVLIGNFGPTAPGNRTTTGAGTLEVWNHALAYFAAEFREWDPPNQDPRVCRVIVSALTNSDSPPPHGSLLPATVQQGRPVVTGEHQAFEYVLAIELLNDGKPMRTRWLEARSPQGPAFVPRSLWVVGHPSGDHRGQGNPFVRDPILRHGLLSLRRRFRQP